MKKTQRDNSKNGGIRGRITSTLSWVLKIGTPMYLIGFSYYLHENWLKIKNMDPNSHGDLLAGAFGSLAFAWLVLGYFQQGEELRESNEALREQAKQLADSVAQQKALVEATTKQLKYQEEMAIETQRQAKNQEAEATRRRFKELRSREREYRSRQPIFKFEIMLANRNTSEEFVVQAAIRNVGAPCVIESLGFRTQSFASTHERVTCERLGSGDVTSWDVTGEVLDMGIPTDLMIKYFDADGGNE